MRKTCTSLFITVRLTAPSSTDSCVARRAGSATASSRFFVLLLLGALLFSTGGGAAVTPPVPDVANCIQPPQGIVSWWRGEGNANDSAGINPGTMVGGASFAAGKVGQSFRLDGIDDYVDLGVINGGPLPTWSVALWANADTAGANRTFISQDRTGFNDDFLLGIEPEGDNFTGLFNRIGVVFQDTPTFSRYFIRDTDDAVVGRWYFVAVTYDGSTMRLWVDGVEKGSASASGLTLADQRWLLGQNPQQLPATYRPFAGKIDEPSIFSRALSGQEIGAMFQADDAGLCTCGSVPPGLMYWWSGNGDGAPRVGTNPATPMNGAGFAPGAVGQGFSFDGIDGYVDLGAINGGSLPTWSVALWASADTAGANRTFMSQDRTGFNDDFLLGIEPEGDNFTGLFNRIGVVFQDTPTFSRYFIRDTEDAVVGRWYSVAVTYDGLTMRLWVDGVEKGSASASGLTLADQRWVLGQNPQLLPATYRPFAGKIDEPSIFGRALSADEIRTIFRSSEGMCDTTPPVITLNGGDAITVDCHPGFTDPGATATDDVDGDLTSAIMVTGSVPPGTPGTYTLTYRVTDTAGNSASLTRTVNVIDTTAPTIPCPPPLTVECAGPAGAVAAYNVTAGDACDPNPAVVCSPQSGSVFPQGSTTVICAATDSSNNISNCSFSVTVVDTTPPVITCPADITRSTDPSQCSAAVTYAPTATDNCGPATVGCTPPSGAAFPKGATTVTCTATDTSTPANTSTCSFTVTVIDTENPTIIGQVGAPGCVTAPAGLVSWWPGDGNANDIKGTNHGTPLNGATFAAGKVGQAFSLDGVNDIVRIANDPSLEPQQVSVDAWLFAESVGSEVDTEGPVVVAKDLWGTSAGGGVSYAILGPGTTGKFNAYVRFTDATQPRLISTNSFSLNAWHHVAMTWDGNTLKLYVNGNLEGSIVVGPKTIGYSAHNLGIGRHPFFSTRDFDGLIDEVEIFNRAISASEVQAIFNAGSAGKCKGTVSVSNDPGQCSAVANYPLPTATDNCPGVTSNCNPASGSSFPVGTATVSCTATDSSGNTSGSTVTVTVTDIEAPTITCPSNVTSGKSANLCSAVVNYSTPSATDNCPNASVLCSPPSGSTFPLGSTTINCAASDAVGNTANCSFTVSVVNHFPSANPGGPYSVNEGSAVVVGASGSDPDGDSLVFEWDLNNDGFLETPGQSASFSAAMLDGPSSHTILVRATDSCGLRNTSAGVVNVLNVAPTVAGINAPTDPTQVNTSITVSASFIDPGRFDTHTALWNWGDGSATTGAVNETNGSGSANGSHTYAAAGVYTVTLSVTDKDGGSGQSVFQYVVVYDPSAGFVTGRGWIDSPLGAYLPNPSLAGRAAFGFVSKYQRGAIVPNGNTQFNFNVVGMNFNSTGYDWLVIAGAQAQFKGTGTINGIGTYAFMLTAIDGEINGGGGEDKFRIKIWNKATGQIIYDNQTGGDDNANPTTSIASGNIIIHAR